MIKTGFDKLHRLQVMKHSWEQQNCGFALLHSVFQSLPSCFPYIMEERHSWCSVTLWLIFWAVPSLMIAVNYRLVPIWPFLFGEASMGFQAATENKIIGEWKLADFSWACFLHLFYLFTLWQEFVFFPSYWIFCSLFTVTFVGICTVSSSCINKGENEQRMKLWSKEISEGERKTE